MLCTACRKQTTPMPAALLPTSRKEREKWGTPTVFFVNNKRTVRYTRGPEN